MSQPVDVIIIGAGPIGIACGLEAKKRNLNYLIIEKGPLVNSLYHYPTNMTFFSTSEKLEIDKIPFISNSPKPTKREALEYYRRIATSNNLHINLFEKVEKVEKQNNNYQITSSKSTYTCKNIIVATGFYDIPNKLNIVGEELTKVSHYYHDPHYYSGQNVAIVGASNSSVDAALEIFRKGGNVTMIVRGKEIGDRVKYWVRPDIVNRIKEGSIKAYFESELKEIRENEIDIATASGNLTLKNDFVLALTGYQPNFAFLNSMGITLSDKEKKIPTYDSQTMETNQKGIYLAGVICGGLETHKWFIENSRIHAKMIMENIDIKPN
ncbi:YpdA family putative bacillithiol disulfide reductase [Mesonia sp. K4-1]|uniref:YpdA family putative bacillithiol disulfide reductase n=1 Tax=Mesonia sp. K4-1 TaxID=2602760 RepID=UPI0011CB1479|nr:YpdA family putative bacillithiol disulfide reductase [Mesonia sp. K4-1]TXK77215.1 YpdA family putative bacillithiol disulfide reductase [Mesonia sp. K4-1]